MGASHAVAQPRPLTTAHSSPHAGILDPGICSAGTRAWRPWIAGALAPRLLHLAGAQRLTAPPPAPPPCPAARDQRGGLLPLPGRLLARPRHGEQPAGEGPPRVYYYWARRWRRRRRAWLAPAPVLPPGAQQAAAATAKDGSSSGQPQELGAWLALGGLGGRRREKNVGPSASPLLFRHPAEASPAPLPPPPQTHNPTPNHQTPNPPRPARSGRAC